jgi:hypothetical protein
MRVVALSYTASFPCVFLARSPERSAAHARSASILHASAAQMIGSTIGSCSIRSRRSTKVRRYGPRARVVGDYDTRRYSMIPFRLRSPPWPHPHPLTPAGAEGDNKHWRSQARGALLTLPRTFGLSLRFARQESRYACSMRRLFGVPSRIASRATRSPRRDGAEGGEGNPLFRRSPHFAIL